SDSHGSPEEGDVVQSVLEDLGDGSIFKNSSHKRPSRAFSTHIWPKASALCSGVIEWNNECNVSAGSKSNARDPISSRLNVDSKYSGETNVTLIEGLQVVERWLDPDFTVRSADFGVLGFASGLREVGYCNRPEVPLAEDSSRMVSAKVLVIGYCVGRERRRAAELGNTRAI